MNIEQVNGVLLRAIGEIQASELEDLTEATAHGVSSYQVPSPSRAVKVKKITVAQVKRALKREQFRLDRHDRSWFLRHADDVTPGVSITEYKFNGRPVEYRYSAQAYRGTDARYRWDSIDRVPLKQAVAWANEYAQEAAEFVAAETGETF